MLLPRIDVSADYAWAGTFGESETGLPSIGPMPGMPNCHAVLGYGGNGLTFGMVAAQLIATRPWQGKATSTHNYSLFSAERPGDQEQASSLSR